MDEVARVLRRRAQPPGAVPPLAMDPGMWLNIVNVKPPYLLDLEIDGMTNFILEYKCYAQKCPRVRSFVRCSKFCCKNTWTSCAVRPARKWRILCCWQAMNLSLPCYVCMLLILVESGD